MWSRVRFRPVATVQKCCFYLVGLNSVHKWPCLIDFEICWEVNHSLITNHRRLMKNTRQIGFSSAKFRFLDFQCVRAHCAAVGQLSDVCNSFAFWRVLRYDYFTPSIRDWKSISHSFQITIDFVALKRILNAVRQLLISKWSLHPTPYVVSEPLIRFDC